MKNLITLLFLTFCFSGFSQNLDDMYKHFPKLMPNTKVNTGIVEHRGSEDFVKDSTYYYWEFSEGYRLLERTIYYYNDQGSIIREEGSNWNDTTQVFYSVSSKKHYLYDDEDRLVEEWDEYYNYNSMWINGSKKIYVYNNDLKVEEIHQEWNLSPDEWQNILRNQFTYDDNDRIEVRDFDVWNPYSNSWAQFIQFQYTYDTDGNNSLTQRFDWDGTLWHLVQQHVMSYNNQNLLIEDVLQAWDSYSMEWLNESRFSYEYDASNNRILYLLEYFDTSNDAFKNYSKEEYSYDDNNNNTQELTFFWYNGWDGETRYDHYWSELPSSTFEPISNEIECKYPNPFIQGNEINCVLENGKDYEFSIFDIQGRMIYHRNILGNSSFGLDQELAIGVFILTIQDERNIVYRDKLIIH